MKRSHSARAVAKRPRHATTVAARLGPFLLPVSVYGSFAAVGHPLLGALPAALVAYAQLAWSRRVARLERHQVAHDEPRPAPRAAEAGASRAPLTTPATPGPGSRRPAQAGFEDMRRPAGRPQAPSPVPPHSAPALPARALRAMLELHDPVTGSHLSRLPEYTRILAQQVALHPRFRNALTPEMLEALPEASTFHDLGKLGVPRSLLRKSGRLTAAEFTIMKRHTTSGGRVLRELAHRAPGNLLLDLGNQIALYHHEHWDGRGYPFGLSGLQIPFAARLVAVTDVYDALTSARPYKPAYSHAASCRYIVSQSGSHFDPDVVEAFLHCHDQFPRVRGNSVEHMDAAPATERIEPSAYLATLGVRS